MDCRPQCGACCIAPSISSPIPGMPEGKSRGKPAGVPCIQLDADYRCRIFGQADRPACCSGLQPSEEMCGTQREHALQFLTQLEALTRPAAQ